MKHRLIIFFAIFIAIESSAQITLEHTFTGYVTWNGDLYFDPGAIVPPNTYFTSTINNNEFNVLIHNQNYSLNSNNTYYFTPPTGYELSSVSFSKNLFNEDDYLEFLATYIKPDAFDNTRTKLHLVNQNGGLIKDFGTSYMFMTSSYLHIADNEFRFLLTKLLIEGMSQTEIYYVPGQVPSNSINRIETLSYPPFPNPSTTTIILPFELNNGMNNTLKIYNSNGQIIKSIQLEENTNKILLDVSGFSKGVFFYEVEGIRKKFIVN